MGCGFEICLTVDEQQVGSPELIEGKRGGSEKKERKQDWPTDWLNEWMNERMDAWTPTGDKTQVLVHVRQALYS